MLLLGFVLNLIKTLTINTDNGTLTDKGMWIYLADKAENGWSLALLGKHEEHLDFLTGIKTGGIYDGHTTVGIRVDALANLHVLLRDDEELDASAATVDHLVDAECLDRKLLFRSGRCESKLTEQMRQKEWTEN